MDKIIIGIVGQISAGKTTITKYLKEKYQAESARFSDSLRDILDRMHLPHTRINLQDISRTLRENFGQDIISKIMKKDIAQKKNIVITEGIRRPTDTTYLKEEYGEKFHIVFLETDARTRYERLTTRSENTDDQAKTWEEFEKEDSRESEQEILKISKQAEFVLNNNGSKEELYNQIDEIMKKICK